MKVNMGKITITLSVGRTRKLLDLERLYPTNRKCCSVGIALKVAIRFGGGVEGHQTEHNEEDSSHQTGHWKMERKTIRHHIFGVAEAHEGCARHEAAKKPGANHESSDECLLQARASVTN